MTHTKACRAAGVVRTISVAVGAAALLAGLADPARAQIWRCGSTYADTPCAQGRAVVADDVRTAQQREQGRRAAMRDAREAAQLAAERRAREAERPVASGIGPTQLERAQLPSPRWRTARDVDRMAYGCGSAALGWRPCKPTTFSP